MAVLTFPSIINPSRARFWLIANTQSMMSPFDNTTQTVEFPGLLWRCTYIWDKLDESHWRPMSAFTNSMRGTAGRVYLGPVHAPIQRGLAVNPVIDGSGQVGDTLLMRNLSASTINIFRAGDFFSYDVTGGRQMHTVRNDVNSNGTGRATVVFDPPMRVSPINGTPVIVQEPTCVMRFLDDEQGQLEFEPPVIGSTSMDFIEAVPSS